MVSTLPDEMVLRIVSYLNDGDFISFANTNKRFLNLLSSERRYVDDNIYSFVVLVFIFHRDLLFEFFRELNLFTGYIGNILTTRTFLFGSPTAAKRLSFSNIKKRFFQLLSSVRKYV